VVEVPLLGGSGGESCLLFYFILFIHGLFEKLIYIYTHPHHHHNNNNGNRPGTRLGVPSLRGAGA
jgi:hypothetical protein